MLYPVRQSAQLLIKRINDTRWWDGNAFNATSSNWFSATGAAGSWTYGNNSMWTSGKQYIIGARGIDISGNTEAASLYVTFIFDNDAPTSYVSYPGNGAK